MEISVQRHRERERREGKRAIESKRKRERGKRRMGGKVEREVERKREGRSC